MTYTGVAQRLVRAVKMRHALGLVELLAAQMCATAPRSLLHDAVVVPVPADPVRRRLRGHDHVALLAAGVGARTGRPVDECLRRRAGPRQVGAARRSRMASGRLHVAVRAPPPAVALLVDDVHTTGATLRSCAAALRAGGCREVRAMTYARALWIQG